MRFFIQDMDDFRGIIFARNYYPMGGYPVLEIDKFQNFCRIQIINRSEFFPYAERGQVGFIGEGKQNPLADISVDPEPFHHIKRAFAPENRIEEKNGRVFGFKSFFDSFSRDGFGKRYRVNGFHRLFPGVTITSEDNY
jgi:hypothetical protein